VASNCINDAHEEVREMAEEAMEELKKQKAKSIAKPH
jgi:vacuolar-type H+-ATPase subunit H